MQALGVDGLRLFFPPLFENHRKSLDVEEVRSVIESLLEEEFELALRLQLLGGERQEEKVEIPVVEEGEAFAQHAQDKSALIVQKVFGVKIRSVFNDHQQALYHLGMSSQFKSEKSRDGF